MFTVLTIAQVPLVLHEIKNGTLLFYQENYMDHFVTDDIALDGRLFRLDGTQKCYRGKAKDLSEF